MSETLKNPIGIDSFPEIVKGGYAYVDKTRYIKELIWNGPYKSLTRPKGFGKTLLVSTLQAYFEGKRELFKGLDLDKMDVKWTPSPVVRLDLGRHDYDQTNTFESVLDNIFRGYEELYGCENERKDLDFSYRLSCILEAAYNLTGQRVAVLIDDLDKPMLDVAEDKESLAANESILKDLLSQLKSSDEYLRFCFHTATAWVIRGDFLTFRININNISFGDRYAEVCGFTKREITNTFYHELETLAEAKGETVENTVKEVVEYYGGYEFSDEVHPVCNPTSVLKAFKNKDVRPYLGDSEFPTIMSRILRSLQGQTPEARKILVEDSDLKYIDLENYSAKLLPFHFGFWTIEPYGVEFGWRRTYRLVIPNKDAEEALSNRKFLSLEIEKL